MFNLLDRLLPMVDFPDPIYPKRKIEFNLYDLKLTINLDNKMMNN